MLKQKNLKAKLGSQSYNEVKGTLTHPEPNMDTKIHGSKISSPMN